MAASRLAKAMNLDIKYVVADGRFLPFRNGLFDFVYSYSVARAALLEIGRLLDMGVQRRNRWQTNGVFAASSSKRGDSFIKRTTLKCDIANLPANTDLRSLAATIKARWTCEQAHQQMKEELGLDHFEGRSWQGLHRHALMTMIAYAFLQHRRLAATAPKIRTNGPPPQPTLPAVRHAILELFARLPRQRCPHCRNGFAASSGVIKSAKVVLAQNIAPREAAGHRKICGRAMWEGNSTAKFLSTAGANSNVETERRAARSERADGL